MKHTYLTIDLDFWARRQVDVVWLHHVLDSIPANDRVAAIHHDSILPHARRYGEVCRRLLNLDFHSDLGGGMEVMHKDGDTDFRRLELHSGSWGDYVQFEDKAEFVWAYPQAECLDDCRCDDFTDYEEETGKIIPFFRIPQAREVWKQLRCYQARPPDYGISLADVRAVSLVLSPDYCGPDAFDVFRALVQQYHLQVLDCLVKNLDCKRLKPNHDT
jgi:hypothetical protein